MIQNYLKTTLRQLWRHAGYSLITILGLAVGLACCMLIAFYVQDELGFDKFHPEADRIYRVALDRQYPGRMSSYAIIPHSYAEAMKEEFPEVEAAVRLFYFQGNEAELKVDERLFNARHLMWADSNFFDLFGIPLLKGDPDRALTDPNGVVLPLSTARKLFGDEDPIGKTIELPGNPNQDQVVVTGVCGDVPAHSHLNFDVLGSSYALGNFLRQPIFIAFSAYTYLLLTKEADPAALETKFPELVRKYASGEIQRQFNQTYDEYLTAGHGYHYFLQPIRSIYLESNLEGEIKPPGSKTRVYIFSVIAFFILLIAIINFMNLATARSTERAKEVGIRKVLGSLRGQLVSQFLFEAFFMTLLSTAIALVLLYYLLPFFNNLSGKELHFSDWISPGFIMILLGTTVLVGLLAGSYPAAVLSGFKPVSVLKGKLTGTAHGAWIRNGLVVFQFAISVALIISTIVVFRQMQYIRKKELGFNEDQVVSIRGAFALEQKWEAFQGELLKLPEVVSAGGCNSMPGDLFFGVSFRNPAAKESVVGRGVFVNDGYIECMQMDMVEGRSFSRSFNDTLSVIINQAALRELGLEAPAAGQRLASNDNSVLPEGEASAYFEVVGVVEDFHFQSLHQPITPLFFVLNQNPGGANAVLTLRLKGDDIQGTIRKIEALWKDFVPDQDFRLTFLDRDLARLYEAEQVAQQVFRFFALLAIFIACIGLLGLAAFITRQRTKEIGIRKVLGASVMQIVGLLSQDFLKLVFLGLLIAAPVAWSFMNRWLANFPYSIRISWWMFALAGAIAILMAFLTVSYLSIRAALANPVESLKDE